MKRWDTPRTDLRRPNTDAEPINGFCLEPPSSHPHSVFAQSTQSIPAKNQAAHETPPQVDE